jgi:hypothetical protein
VKAPAVASKHGGASERTSDGDQAPGQANRAWQRARVRKERKGEERGHGSELYRRAGAPGAGTKTGKKKR